MSADLALPDLAQAIEVKHKAAHAAARYALEHAVECGRLLLEAKAAVSHGEWLPWLEANTNVSARQSQRYMRLATTAIDIDDALTVLQAHGVRKMALDELLELGCVITPVSLSLPKGLSFEDWLRVGNLLPTIEHDQIALYGQKLLECADRLNPLQDKIRAAVEAGEAMPDFAESIYERTCELIARGGRWRAACAKVTLAIANAKLHDAVEAKLKAQRQAVVLAGEAAP